MAEKVGLDDLSLPLGGIPDLEVRFDEPLSKHTSYKIGGPTKVLVYPKTQKALVKLLELLSSNGVGFRMLGGGSNLLVADEGIDDVVISTRKLRRKRVSSRDKGSAIVNVEAGVMLAELILWGAKRGIYGYERFYGIPASVGGAVVNNLSSFGLSISDYIVSVKFWSREDGLREIKVSRDMFRYRGSVFKDRSDVILSAKFRLPYGKTPEEIKMKAFEYFNQRRLSQPLEYPSCGCVFKNPSSDLKAWYLIDSVGLRGARVGKAKFSEKHANFIVNMGGASADDVLALINLAKTKVKEEFNVDLEEEVEVWR